MLLEQRITHQNRFGVSQTEQPGDFLATQIALERNRGRPDALDREVRHSPLGGVLSDQSDVIARGQPLAGQECGGSDDAFPEVGIRVPLLSTVPGDPHRDPPGVVFGTGFEEFVEGSVGMDPALRPAPGALLILKGRENPTLEPGQVYVEPVVVPVDFFGIEEQLCVVPVESGKKIPRVVGAENELLASDERPEGVVLPFALDDKVLERIHVPLQCLDDSDQGAEGPVASPLQGIGERGSGPAHPLEGVLFETIGANGLRLHPGERLVPKLHPGRFIAEVATLVDPHEVDESFHPRRISVAARHLVHEVGLRHHGFGSYGKGGRRNQVHRHDIQDHPRAHRKQILSAKSHPDERSARGKALVPPGVGK